MIGIAELALAIKTAVHDYVEMVEKCQEEEEDAKKNAELNDHLHFSINPCYALALEPLMSSLYWGYNGYYFHYSEAEFEKIQSIITENGVELLFAIRVALTEWKSDFEKRRADGSLPEYTPAYIREQVDKFDLRRELGISIDHEGMEFALSLANIHALKWVLREEFPQAGNDQQTTNPAAELITDKRKKLSDELFEKELLPEIIDKLQIDKSLANKHALFDQIVEPYKDKTGKLLFGGSTVQKRFEKNYMKDKNKLIDALKKYGNERLIEQIKHLR